jgi:hypothetical protein
MVVIVASPRNQNKPDMSGIYRAFFFSKIVAEKVITAIHSFETKIGELRSPYAI